MVESDGNVIVYAKDFVTIRNPKPVAWVPVPDITVYELARAMPVLLAAAGGHCDLDRCVEALPAEVQRHFTIRD